MPTEQISLQNNSLTGHIPTEMGLLTQLTSLLLHENELSGEIPSELSLLTALGKLSSNFSLFLYCVLLAEPVDLIRYSMLSTLALRLVQRPSHCKETISQGEFHLQYALFEISG